MNENLFSKIDNEISAYIYGYILGDGSLGRNISNVEIVSADEQILRDMFEYVKDFSSFSIPVVANPKWKQTYKLRMNSIKAKYDLINLGLCVGKSRIDLISNGLVFPEEPYLFHFLRGFLDSDGSIVSHKLERHERRCYALCFCSGKPNVNLLLKIRKLLYKDFCIKGGVGQYGEGAHLSYTSFDMKHLISLLYKNSTLFLERKRERALQAFNSGIELSPRWYDKVLVRQDLRKGLSDNEIREKYGFKWKVVVRQFRNRENVSQKEFEAL